MQPSSGRAPGREVTFGSAASRLGRLGAVSANAFTASALRAERGVEPRYLLAISSSSLRRSAQNSRIVGVDCTMCSRCSGRTWLRSAHDGDSNSQPVGF